MSSEVYRLSAYSTLVVAVHALVNAVHGYAHVSLGVLMSWLANVFIVSVIMIAPILAAALLWTKWRRQGAWLLSASMAGSLLFGAYNHFVAVSEDHIFHVPRAGSGRTTFQITAVLLALIELSGCLMGARLLSALRSASETVLVQTGRSD